MKPEYIIILIFYSSQDLNMVVRLYMYFEDQEFYIPDINLMYMFNLRSPERGDRHSGAGVAGATGQSLSLPHPAGSP